MKISNGVNFFQKVYEVVEKIPAGKVATYGQIASMISSPRAARQVGTALRFLDSGTKIPWHRVINSRGMVSIENLSVPKALQAERLQADGVRVEFRDGNFCIDLGKYLWKPKGFRYTM